MVVGHLPHRLVVPEHGAVACDHVEAHHLEASVALQADAVELAGVPVRVVPGAVVHVAPVVVAVVADEDLVGAACGNLADAWRVSSAENGTTPVAAGQARVAIRNGIARQVQAVTRVIAVEALVARLQQIERGIRGHPEVLFLVGGDAHDRRLLDAVRVTVGDVAARPGSGTAEGRAAVVRAAVGAAVGGRAAVDLWSGVRSDVRRAAVVNRADPPPRACNAQHQQQRKNPPHRPPPPPS